jgi:hypothetical protein
VWVRIVRPAQLQWAGVRWTWLVVAAGCGRVGFGLGGDPSGDLIIPDADRDAVSVVGVDADSGALDGAIDGTIDAAVDAAIDMAIDTPAQQAACLSNPAYTTLGSQPHTYRYYTTQVQWQPAVDLCAADGAHLVILDNSTEASLLQNTWVGVSDIANEGVWITVLGDPAPYLPWMPGEPDGGTASNCVRFQDSSNQISDWDCVSNVREAMCECE